MSFAWLILRATVQYHTIVESRRGLRPVPVLLKIIIVRQKSRSNFIKNLQKYTPPNLTLQFKNNNNKHWALFPLLPYQSVRPTTNYAELLHIIFVATDVSTEPTTFDCN